MSHNSTPSFRDIELNALDPKTRRRLIDAIDGRGGPAPIIAARSATGGAIAGWAFLSLIGLGAMMMAALVGFGEVYEYAQPWLFIAGYAIALWFTAWGVLGAVRSGALSKAVPFKRGRYVFPTDVVIATTPKLRILPMARLIKLDGVHRHVNGAYTGTDLHFIFEGHGRETFVTYGKENAEQILANLRVAQQRLAEALQHQDLDLIEAFDVFFEARIRPEWNDPQAAARTARTPERAQTQFALGKDGVVQTGEASDATLAKPVSPILLRAGMVSLLAAVLAPALWLGRNFASDEAAFASATSLNSTWAYNAYVAADGRHAAEVTDRWLPEAAFAEAQRAGTVTALRDFVRAHPQSRRAPEARAAIHARFAQVRADFLRQAATTDPTMPVFMGHLLDWLEAHDSPPVRVRFFAPSAEALALIDQNLDVFGQVQGVTGGIAPVAPHFTPERSAPRESSITSVLQQGFAPIFPTDVMQLAHAGRIDAAQQSAEITEPAFDVSYTIRPSGQVYTSDTSTRGFVGIFVEFHIQMRIPGSAETWSVDTSVEPPETFTVQGTSYDSLGLGIDSSYRDGLVYSVMADRAFDQLENRLALAFFREDSAAYQQAHSAAENAQRGEQPAPNPYGSLPGLGALPPAPTY